MDRRALAASVVAIALSTSLAGCSCTQERGARTTLEKKGAPSADQGGTATDTANPKTLSKTTLPTKAGITWTTVRSDGQPVPIDFKVAGPWTLRAGTGWGESPSEIVDPASVKGIEKFDDVTFVVKSSAADSPVYYYPRRVTNEWVQGLGRITVQGDTVTPEPSEVSNIWPLDLEVGKEYPVAETDSYKTVATVLARNRATVPAGTIENAYLVRFRSTLAANGEQLDNYYLLAADTGLVAWLSELSGTEKAGFTSAKNIVLLSTLPTK